MSILRDLVAAWEAQGARCAQAYSAMNEGVRRELESVGGSATTSPDADGYCRTFEWMKGTGVFCEGAIRVGGVVQAKHPEVGDRCGALERSWRKEATALTEAGAAIQRYVRLYANGSNELWRVAVALVKSERSEREAIVRWMRAGYPGTERAYDAVDLVPNLADAIERGDHVRVRPSSRVG